MSITGQYTIRRFRSEDRDEVFSLFERTVHPWISTDDEGVSDEWFDWRFVRNPFADSVPLTVAVHDDDVIGVRSSLPIDLDVGGRRTSALYQGDAAVHRDHRRRGLFTRMVTYDYQFYAGGAHVLSYGSPVLATRKALQKLHREQCLPPVVEGEIPKYYRVQNPNALAGELASPIASPGVRVTNYPVRWAMAALDALASSPVAVTVRVQSGVPGEELVELAARGPRPRGAHAFRDEQFYRWRYANPRFEYRTYTVRRDGATVASVIVERPRSQRPDVVRIVEALPLDDVGNGPDVRPWLLTRVIDAEGAGALAVFGSLIPARSLVRSGFFPSDAPPLSWVTRSDGFIARPLPGVGPDDEDDGWVLNDVRLSDPSNWSLSGADINLR